MSETTGHDGAPAGAATVDEVVQAGETEAAKPLKVVVKVYERPWSPTTFSDEDFDDLLLQCARRTAERIADNRAKGKDGYTRDSFAIALMNPTAGPWEDNEDATMAVILIGDEAEDFEPNALAKAWDGRTLFYNTGQSNVGVAVYTASHLLPDGAFRYGHATRNCGGSGQSESIDLKEAALTLRDVLDAVDEAREFWESLTGPGRWFTQDNTPGEEYRIDRYYLEATLGDVDNQ